MITRLRCKCLGHLTLTLTLSLVEHPAASCGKHACNACNLLAALATDSCHDAEAHLNLDGHMHQNLAHISRCKLASGVLLESTQLDEVLF